MDRSDGQCGRVGIGNPPGGRKKAAQSLEELLEYWFDNSMFSKWTKPPKEFNLDETVMTKDIAVYKALGTQQLASFACYLGPDYEEIYEPVDITPYTALIG